MIGYVLSFLLPGKRDKQDSVDKIYTDISESYLRESKEEIFFCEDNNI